MTVDEFIKKKKNMMYKLTYFVIKKLNFIENLSMK